MFCTLGGNMKEFLGKLLIAAIAALAPIKTILVSLGFLILADLITGMWAAHKRGEKITSAAMRRTVSKIVVYQLAVISGFILEKYLLGGAVAVSNIVAGVIGMVEFKSMLENSNQIVGQDIFKAIISKLGSENDKDKKE
jgi:sugar phosphate permease